ncbi:MAG: heterodisulfide reductase-related iron-sulfur binding cluster, partial [Candidatus Dormibacteria bacterium]
EYDAPRRVLEALPGSRLVEMERHRNQAMCCGAGGGRMWIEERSGERINRVRVAQAAATGASVAALACPFCATMFKEGSEAQELPLESADLAVLVARAMGLEPQPAAATPPQPAPGAR